MTGATGYVAGWLVKKLLEDGATVHACVRDPSNRDKLKYLDAIAAETPGTIRYFGSDLMEEGSYADAMQDCAVVFHTASPFTLSVDDPQKELIDPAVRGTRNVLETANRTETVRRVVVTSSLAAIQGDNVDIEKKPNGKFTEEDWNESSSLEHMPYAYSKTLAEREAWAIADAQDRWSLVTINPSFVIGPGIHAFATSETFDTFRKLADGTGKMGIPALYMCAVDVRDVADAHIAAGFTPGAAGRYIASAHDTSLVEFARLCVPALDPSQSHGLARGSAGGCQPHPALCEQQHRVPDRRRQPQEHRRTRDQVSAARYICHGIISTTRR